MDINVTSLLAGEDEFQLMRFSASRFEMGDHAGETTWRNAMEAMSDPEDWLVSEEGIGEIRDYFLTFGAWDGNELGAMSGQELNAMLVQFVAGDARRYLEAQGEGPEAFAAYQDNEGGQLCETEAGEWFYYVGV